MGGKLTGVTSDALQQCDRKRSLDQAGIESDLVHPIGDRRGGGARLPLEPPSQ